MRQRAAMRRTLPASPVEENVEEAPVATMQEPVVRMRTTAPSTRGLSPLTFDYSHIYGDLRRIALFAGFFFAVLIVLSFVIR